MPKVLNALTDVETPELSLVARGAQRKPVAFTKSEEGMPDGMEEILKSVLELELDNEAEVEKVLKAGDMSDKGKLAVRSALKVLGAFKEEMPRNVMETLSKLSGFPGAKQDPPEDPKAPKPENGKEGAAKIKKQTNGDYPYPKPIKKADGRYQFDESVPEEIRPQLAALWKSQEAAEEREKEAVKKAEELETILKAERDERREKEFIKKAEELPLIPGEATEKGKLLKQVSDLDSDLGGKIEEIFKTLNEQLAQSALLEIRGGGGGKEVDAYETIVRKAEEIRKADPSLSAVQARVKVIKEHPELKAAYYEEKGN
jgi:hypothetical protein